MAVDNEALAEYVRAGQDLRGLTLQALQALLDTLNLSDADEVVQQLERLLPSLITRYGEVAAVAAADYYERSRPKGLPPVKRVLAAAQVDDLGPSIGWAAKPLYQAEQDVPAFTGRLEQVTDAAVKETGTNTFLELGRRDPVKPLFARVPVGKTCKFCLMLGSRGFVYSSQVAAESKKFHADCDCSWVAEFSGDPHLAGYDPEALQEQFRETYKAPASKTSEKPIGGFNDLTPDLLQKQLDTMANLPDSEWNRKQTKKVKDRLAELANS